MIRWTTLSCIGLFAVSAALFSWSVVRTDKDLDRSVPVITMDSDSIRISIEDDESKILEGVTAVDATDGDVTDSLVVESMSNFLETGVRKASIVAFDSDNHVTRVEREVVYTDYTSPRFSLDEPLEFTMEEDDFISGLHVEDCLDGDITSKIHMSYDEEDSGGSGDVKVTYYVSNSVGDTVTLPVTLTRYDSSEQSGAPTIQLTKYLVYAKSGKKFDAGKYLKSVTVRGTEYQYEDGELVCKGYGDEEDEVLDSDLWSIDDPVRKKPGTYEVTYSVTDPGRDEEDSSDDVTQTVRLIVVVYKKGSSGK